MELISYGRRLGLAENILEVFAQHPVPDADMARLRSVFWGDWQQAETILTDMEPLQILSAYLALIPEAQQKYAQLGLPEQVLWDGLRDIGIWSREHQRRFGRPGLCAWPWVAKTLRLEIFRLGRLQFEPGVLENGLRAGDTLLPAGMPVLNVHIPAEEPLDVAAVQESLSRANPFFRAYFGVSYPVFHCHSWLLSPQLQELLPSDSRILQFQRLFLGYGTCDERQAEERVFGQVQDDPGAYPEDTSLQRKMKQYLLSGRPVQVGMGIYIPET